jgi:hypothetical protein
MIVCSPIENYNQGIVTCHDLASVSGGYDVLSHNGATAY